MAEWLRRWTANPLGSARVGSNPIFVATILVKTVCLPPSPIFSVVVESVEVVSFLPPTLKVEEGGTQPWKRVIGHQFRPRL